jgi:hypothetical protein
MKRTAILAAALLAPAAITNSAVIFQLNFDGPVASQQAMYVPGPGDIIPNGCVIATDAFAGWGGGWASNPPNAPSIISQSTSMQGGNALGVMVDANNNVGYNVNLGDGTTSNSVTVEILVKVDEDFNNVRNEYGMEAFIGNEAGGGSPVWALRTLGQFGAPQAEVQLMTNPSGTEINYGTGAAPSTTEMVHWAIVLDRANNRMELYKAGSKLGEATGQADNYLNKPFALFSIGNFPNPAGSSRSLIGRIDAVAISDQALGAGSFVLSTTTTSVSDWTIY